MLKGYVLLVDQVYRIPGQPSMQLAAESLQAHGYQRHHAAKQQHAGDLHPRWAGLDANYRPRILHLGLRPRSKKSKLNTDTLWWTNKSNGKSTMFNTSRRYISRWWISHCYVYWSVITWYDKKWTSFGLVPVKETVPIWRTFFDGEF